MRDISEAIRHIANSVCCGEAMPIITFYPPNPAHPSRNTSYKDRLHPPKNRRQRRQPKNLPVSACFLALRAKYQLLLRIKLPYQGGYENLLISVWIWMQPTGRDMICSTLRVVDMSIPYPGQICRARIVKMKMLKEQQNGSGNASNNFSEIVTSVTPLSMPYQPKGNKTTSIFDIGPIGVFCIKKMN